MPQVEPCGSGIFGIHHQGVTAHGALGIEASLHGAAQQQRPDALAAPALITGEASHPEAGHGVGRQGPRIANLQVSERNLSRSQGVEAGNRGGVVSRHQHKRLADAPAHGLVGVLLEKAIQCRDTAAEPFAIVAFGIEPLLLKHG
jgi:hypothetical protein